MDNAPRKKRRLVKIYRRPVSRHYSTPKPITPNFVGIRRVNSAAPGSFVNEDSIRHNVELLSNSSILLSSNEIQSQVIPARVAVKRLYRVKHDDDISNNYIQENSKNSLISDKSQSEVFDDLQQSTSSVETVPTKVTRYSIPTGSRIHTNKRVKPTYDYDVIESSIIPSTSSQTSIQPQRSVKVVRSTSAKPPYHRKIRRKIFYVRKNAENVDDGYGSGWFGEYCPCWSKCCCLIATLLLALLLLAGLIALLALLLTSKSTMTTTITTTLLTDTTISTTGCDGGSGGGQASE